MVAARPAPVLRGHVAGYAGLRVDADRPLRGRAVAGCGVTLFLDFAASVRVVSGPDRPLRVQASHVTGLHDRPVLFEQHSRHRGMAVELTPPGAYALFGVPMRELSNTTVDLADLLGRRAERLTGRLRDAPDWATRFALLDSVLPAWFGAGPQPAPTVLRAWRLLRRTGGTVSVAALAEEAGVTRRCLEMRFAAQIGLPPKTIARLVRFERAARLLTAPAGPPPARIAAVCGYADQAHLTREFRALAGRTPTTLRAEHAAATTVH
ncbi:AraC family transcriptional regulator [Actinoallomurus soli]|uniref:AraC family transcriptional regulator n=1 Tax=Actinoallomurus soli TaxID=2952535 RepID=UPI002092FD5A|nr:helix-turn-helix domain-containing protein [Actinoallomurus soli]MCO5972370.1 helix-turn-helix domain-containing protein [Actinoallomurus soli]